MRPIAGVVLVATVLLASSALSGQERPSAEAIDAVFAALNDATPGCAVGVSQAGVAHLRAYGSADLEHGVAITPDTIFEAGSVTKQFTAAAVVLLARDGKLSLDDPVRKYLPELPDYGTPLTIRHMLGHTAGLRDWGSLAAVGGWPRGSRSYTQAHVLEIASRQRALNFTSGTRWSYTNTGYNLAAIIVERVSGTTVDDFTRRRIFEPLEMTRTSWRSDHTRIVKDRAIAYARRGDGYRTNMPFEDAVGNGGLLTTVGDLLKWNGNFVAPRVGDAAFVAEMQEPGRLSNGKAHSYAMGLGVRTYKGLQEIGHDGATAGYTADLIRFPERDLSVAVLCNASSLVAPRLAHQVADIFIGDTGTPTSPPLVEAPHTLTDDQRTAIVGTYASVLTGTVLRITAVDGSLKADSSRFSLPLIPTSAARFTTTSGVFFESPRPGVLEMIDTVNPREEYRRVSTTAPTSAAVRTLVGTYSSSEADVTLTVRIGARGGLEVWRAPASTFALTPAYADAFSSPSLGLVRFQRQDGQVVTMSISQDRVWDLRLERVGRGGR